MATINFPPLPKRHKYYSLRIKTKEPTLEEILVDVCECFKRDIEKVKSKRQFIRNLICRRIYCYVAHVLTNESVTKIGQLINKDHTSCCGYIDQCFTWFEIDDHVFKGEWDIYTQKSKIWNEYFQIRNT